MNKIPALLAMIALSIGFTARVGAADAAPTPHRRRRCSAPWASA